jgi:hypothetical protein
MLMKVSKGFVQFITHSCKQSLSVPIISTNTIWSVFVTLILVSPVDMQNFLMLFSNI